MKKLLWKLFHPKNSSPVWTLDLDGEVRKTILIRDGDIILIAKHHNYLMVNPDGSAQEKSYIKRWYPREL